MQLKTSAAQITCQEHGKKISFINIQKIGISRKLLLCSACQLQGELLKLDRVDSILKEASARNKERKQLHLDRFEQLRQSYLETIEHLSVNFKQLLESYQNSKFLDLQFQDLKFPDLYQLGEYVRDNIICQNQQYSINISLNEESINNHIENLYQILLTIQEFNDNWIDLSQPKDCVLYKSLEGHTKEVSAVQFNHSQTLLISGQLGGDLFVWELPKFTKIQLLEGHTAAVRDIQFNISDQLCVTGSEDRSIRIWKCEEKWQIQQILEGHTLEVISAKLSPRNDLIISCSNDKTIKIWNKNKNFNKSYELQQTLGDHKNPVRCVCLNRDFVAAGGGDKVIEIWQGQANATWILQQTLLGHTDCIHSLAFCKKLLASGGQDNQIILWEMLNGKYQLTKILKEHTERIFDLSFSNSHGDLLISASGDRSVKFWQKDTNWNCIQTIVEKGRIYSISANKGFLAIGNFTKSIPIYINS